MIVYLCICTLVYEQYSLKFTWYPMWIWHHQTWLPTQGSTIQQQTHCSEPLREVQAITTSTRCRVITSSDTCSMRVSYPTVQWISTICQYGFLGLVFYTIGNHRISMYHAILLLAFLWSPVFALFKRVVQKHSRREPGDVHVSWLSNWRMDGSLGSET